MQLTAFNGIDFVTIGVTAKYDNVASRGPAISVQGKSRLGNAPIVPAASVGAETITAVFTAASNFETTLLKVIALIRPYHGLPCTLSGQLNDGIPVEALAIPGSWRYGSVNQLLVDFTIVSECWFATTLALGDVTLAGQSGMANPNDGYAEMLPDALSIYTDDASRPTPTADFGWQAKVEYTITNIGSETLIDQPWQIGPINTGFMVTDGNLRADGNDLRIFVDGVEQPRNVIGINTSLSFIWIVIPFLAPGASCQLVLACKNPNAGAPPTLSADSTPMQPAMDISGEVRLPTSSTTSSVTMNYGQNWEADRWKGGTLMVEQSANPGPMRRISGNTTVTVNVERAFASAIGSFECAVLKSGLIGDGGIVTSISGAQLHDSAQSWGTNEWAGATLEVISGAHVRSRAMVIGNDATSLTFDGWDSGAPVTGDEYRVYRANGCRMWDVRTTGGKKTGFNGLWWTNKTQAPPTKIDFDAPGSWYRFAYLDNGDCYSQPRYTVVSVGAGDNDYFPVMRIQRSRQGVTGQHSELGLADAIGYASPFPLNGVVLGYQMRNNHLAGSGTPGAGMCEARFMCQESGGENWSTFLSDNAIRPSEAGVGLAYYDLTGFGSPSRIAATLIPSSGDELPRAENHTAVLDSNGEYVKVIVNPSAAISESIDWVQNPNVNPVDCYDVWLTFETRGGTEFPRAKLTVGGPDRRVFLVPVEDEIIVDCHKQIAIVRNSVDIPIPFAIQSHDIVLNRFGDTVELLSTRWLPLPSTIYDAANIEIDDPSGAGWPPGNIHVTIGGYRGYLL